MGSRREGLVGIVVLSAVIGGGYGLYNGLTRKKSIAPLPAEAMSESIDNKLVRVRQSVEEKLKVGCLDESGLSRVTHDALYKEGLVKGDSDQFRNSEEIQIDNDVTEFLKKKLNLKKYDDISHTGILDVYCLPGVHLSGEFADNYALKIRKAEIKDALGRLE